MKQTDGATTSSWYAGVKIPKFPHARSVAKVDVAVIGAGIAGLTIAYFLAQEGLSVIVLDEGEIGGGQTGRTSAHLASAIDDRFMTMEKLHGAKGSRLAYESHAAAIDAIEKICRTEKVACDFARLDGLLCGTPDDPPGFLEKEFAAARRAGFAEVELLSAGGIGDAPCIRFGRQARFQPMAYLIGLATAVKRKGGRIYTGRRVMDVQGSDPKKKKPAQITLQGMRSKIKADHVVVATNTPAPINDWFGIYTKQASYRSYVIAATIPRGVVKDALYWDTADPYHYVRLQPQRRKREDLLIVGGEDHKTGQIPELAAPFLRLETWAREHFPQIGEIRYHWSGQVQEPADGLAFIGRALTAKQEVFVATGDSGMGLTHGTIAGMLITDLIAGRPNPWERLYDPSRKMDNREFVSDNLNTLAQYKDLLTRGDVESIDDIPANHGAVVREGLKKIAVYRDPAGKIHRHSALCTHLQCVVRWNGIEKSWDCPCHGSRFDPKGKVVMGPAIDDLASA